MFASLLTDFPYLKYLISSPFWLAVTGFQIWMFIHALRQKEYVWAFFIIAGWGLSAMWYYFSIYRQTTSATSGFELPGAQHRRRIKELQAQIHHLDKPHHHSQLGDVYFQQGKLGKAEACYRAAMERDGEDIDTRAHLGQCLLRRKRAAEAKPLLESVVWQDAKHDYGHSLMALAETLTALGETDRALPLWQQVTEQHSYPRARVQLAELLLARGDIEPARAALQEVLSDAPHAPAFQRRRDRSWVRKARALLRQTRR
jgi:tetratricopeptide (TPR) repeat protein